MIVKPVPGISYLLKRTTSKLVKVLNITNAIPTRNKDLAAVEWFLRFFLPISSSILRFAIIFFAMNSDGLPPQPPKKVRSKANSNTFNFLTSFSDPNRFSSRSSRYGSNRSHRLAESSEPRLGTLHSLSTLFFNRSF